jgi:hypothetical protein
MLINGSLDVPTANSLFAHHVDDRRIRALLGQTHENFHLLLIDGMQFRYCLYLVPQTQQLEAWIYSLFNPLVRGQILKMAAELIPQSKLFGNADKAEPKIAPDGKRYAYLASSKEKGVRNNVLCQYLY